VEVIFQNDKQDDLKFAISDSFECADAFFASEEIF